MSRSRKDRRYLTEKYQAKQERYHKQYWGPYPDRNKRPLFNFLCELYGVDPWYKFDYTPTAERLGRWRNVSFSDIYIFFNSLMLRHHCISKK